MIASLCIARIARIRAAITRATGIKPDARPIAERVIDREAAHLSHSRRIALRRVLLP